MQQRLRVAVLLDSPIVPAWIQRVLAEVRASDAAELVAALFDGSAEPPAARPQPALFRAFQRLDRRWFAPDNDADRRLDARPLLEGCEQRTVVPQPIGDAFALPPDPAAALRALAPDVILKLGWPPLAGEILDVAPLGVWSFDHVEQIRRGGAPFFMAMVQGAPATETCLRAEESGGTRVLARSFAATDPTSVVRGRHFMQWKSASFVTRALRDAAAGVRPPFDKPTQAVARRECVPGSVETLRFVGRVAWRVARERRRLRSADFPWFVALRPSRGSLVDGPMAGFRPIPMPADRFYADPFLVEDGARLWLFFEDAELASGKGLIRCAEVLADGSLGESRVVLERDYHLSYPFVFRCRGGWFMLPETHQHGTVELWRADEFPWRWSLEKILLHGVLAVDPTLVEHEGRLWLFANVSELGGSMNDELFLFSADSLHGEWRPHPRNPVVSDVRYARPAGPFFREGGRLYRPGQDCSGDYGSAFWIHRVDRLDEHDYQETPVRRVGPDWFPGLVATHAIHRAGGFDAIDGRLWLRRGESLSG